MNKYKIYQKLADGTERLMLTAITRKSAERLMMGLRMRFGTEFFYIKETL